MRDWRKLLEQAREFRAKRNTIYDMRKYWRVLGYHEANNLSEAFIRAMGFGSVLKNMAPVVRDEDVFAGSSSGVYLEKLPPDITEEQYKEACKEHDVRGQRDFWAGFDHSIADYPTLLSKGIGGYIKQAEASLKTHKKAKETDFLKSVIITLEALQIFIRRHIITSNNKEIALSLRHISEHPPRTLFEAIQLVWFVHLAFWTEGRYSMALGRIDQYLLPFYERDLKAGRITREDALNLFCHLWVKLEEIGEIFNICIGGLTPDGKDGTNELSYICLDATRLVQSPSTNISARFHDDTPERFHRECFECIRTGVGFPAIFNDHVLIPGLERIGIPTEIARDHCMVGCIETMLAGRQQAWSDSRFNTALTLMKALNKMRYEPNPSYEMVISLFRGELEKDMVAHTKNFNEYIARFPVEKFPDLFLSALTRDCIARAKDINDGGAEFKRFHGIAIMGLATVADSLAAIKKLVFEEKALTFDQLMKAIDTDFEGHEPIRHMLMNRAPKYGNDDDYVDDIAAQIVEWTTSECLKHEVHGGGRFIGGMAANVSNIYSGKEVGATPDGRKAFTPLSDAASPFFGRDIKGPTAFIKSVSAPDYSKALLGSVVNMKFEPEFFQGEEGAKRFNALTHTFVKDRIQELQFNFTGNKALLEAQKNPQAYLNLVVRVSGFSAYFVTLDKEVQEDIIRRRAHT